MARADAPRLRALRLAALAADPDAFGSTLARDSARPAAWWEDWARASELGVDQRTFVLVDADGGGDWIGLALVRRAEDHAAAGELLSMWVAPSVRGRGGARLLCDACVAWARERGLRALQLEVFAGNHPARRAYEAAGFAVVGRADVQAHGGRRLEELRMERAI